MQTPAIEQKSVKPTVLGQFNRGQAIALALQGIDNYIGGRYIFGGNRLGQWHGAAGKRRARKLKKILTELPVDLRSTETILAIFGALFGEPTFFPQLGRSSLLACHIADKWITGSRHITTGDTEFQDNLASRVFSSEILDQLKKKHDSYTSIVHGEMGGSTDFDATKAVRVLYQSYLKLLNPNDKFFVTKLSSLIKNILNSSSEDIQLEKILNFIEFNSTGTEYIRGALTGAFFGKGEDKTSERPVSSAPAMTIDAFQKHVASFLNITDGTRLSRVSRTAYNMAGEAIGRPALVKPSEAPLTPAAATATARDRKSSSLLQQGHFKPNEQKVSGVLPSLRSSAAPESTVNLLGIVTQLFSTHGPKKELTEKEIEVCVIALEKLATRTEEQDTALLNQNKAVIQQAVSQLQDFLTYEAFPFEKTSSPGSNLS